MTILNAGEDAEQLDHSYIAGGNIKWHSHSGQQFAAPGLRAQTQQLRRMGSVALRYVGSSWIRDRTYVSCIGKGRLFTSGPPGNPNSTVLKAVNIREKRAKEMPNISV